MVISKFVAHQLRYSRAVLATGELNIEPATAAIEEQFGNDGKVIAEALRVQCGLLKVVTDDFAAADRRLAKDLADDARIRAKCEECSGRLAKLLVSCRTRLRDAVGEKALELYGLKGRIPTNREAIAHYAGHVSELMKVHPLRATDLFGSEFSSDTLVGPLQQALADYQHCLSEVAREARETEGARNARIKAERRFRRILVGVAAALEAHFRMAGFDDLADKIRPTRGRASGEEPVEIAGDGTEIDTGDVGNDNTEDGGNGTTEDVGNDNTEGDDSVATA